MDDDNHIGDIESVAELDRVIALAKFAVNAKNIELRARALAKLNRHIREAEAKLAAVQAQAEQTNNVLAERERAVAAREIANERHEIESAASLQEAHDHLRGYYNSIAEADRHLRYRIMNYAGLLHGYNAQLQELPDWRAIKQMIPDLPDLPAPAADVVSENVREDWVGHTFVPGSTLTRTVSYGEN